MAQVSGRPGLRLGLVLLLGLHLVISCSNADSGAQGQSQQGPTVSPENLPRVTLRITGMTWGAWARIVQLALARLDGVHKADVSFRKKQAQVEYLPDRVSVQQMLDAVAQAGFGAEVMQGGG